MKHVWRIVLFLLAFVTATPDLGQNNKWFTAEKDLSSSMINSIYQDRKGIIWIATENGLNRYDGAKFTVYKNDPANPNSLSNNNINCIFEDSKRRIWIGTMSGLNLFDPGKNTFTNIPLQARNYSTSNANIQTILERKDGTVLVATSGYSALYEIKTGADNQVSTRLYALYKRSSSLINMLYEDKKRNLWISFTDKGLFRMTPDHRLRPARFSGGTQWDNPITCMQEDAKGNLYAGSFANGLYRFDAARQEFQPVVSLSSAYLSIKNLYVFNRDNMLVGTDGNGLKNYDIRTNSITDFPLNITTFPTANAKIHSVLKDNKGNLWIGFYQKGVLLVPAVTNNFHYIGYLSPVNNYIGSSCVTSLLKTDSGVLLVGTDNDGMYCLPDRNGKGIRHFGHTAIPSSVPSTIMTIFEDSRHRVWLGSYLSGMAEFNPTTGQCRYVNNLKDEKGVPVKAVYGFAEDKKGRLWIGTNGSGLFFMDPDKNKIVPCKKNKGRGNHLINQWINALLCSDDDKLYIGTYGGLSCLDLRTMNYDPAFYRIPQLTDQVIYTLHEDARHNIWIGSYTGLLCLNPKTKAVRKYTVKDGLPDNVIVSIQEDKRHNLWIGTSHGLVRFDAEKQQFINYYTDDGIQGNEFSKNAAFTYRDGEMFFGGTNGVTFFYPEQIRNSKKKPEIRVTGFYIHGNEVNTGMKSGFYSIIDTDVMDADRFELADYDNSFTIEFSAMEFYNPERVNYSYCIDNDKWINLAPGTNRLSFSDLTPGTYHFKVRSRDYDTFSDIREFTVVIRPAWYASWLAFIVYILIITAGVYYGMQRVKQKYRYEKKMQEHIHAEQLNEAKLQFFINISHEIRTPMSLIISPLQKLMANDGDKERQKDYSIIMRNAKRILRLINQLMDVRKIDKGQMALHFRETNINDFILDICKTFEFQMHRKHIQFTFQDDVKDVNAWVDPENFDKIILNLLSNALKFTPEHGRIEIRLTTGTDETTDRPLRRYFEISVKDSGIGIAPDKMEHIFERFYQIRNSINNATVGTGVGLHLVHSLVKLHHGSIRVRNNENEPGCTFTLRIPLGKAHLHPEEMDQSKAIVNKTNENIDLAYTDGREVFEKEDKEQSKTKLRVLLVEDDEEIRHYISHELSGKFHIAECANGQEAWDSIRKKTPDLVISDIMMPVMDGLTLCKKIKQNINTNTVPVILLTAKTREEEQMEGLDTGADAYITKPFNIEYLCKSVENLIRNREVLRNSYRGNQIKDVDISALKEESPDEKLMRRVMRVINENISDPNLNVDVISREVGISRVHLYRKLKELTNQSTRDFLRNIRLRHAAELLKEGNSNVTRIAQLTGFSSIAVFSHSFKELYGVTPTEYASQNGKKEKPES